MSVPVSSPLGTPMPVATHRPTQSRTWTVLEILQTTQDFFRKRGIESARLDAELLLARVLGVARIQLYAQYDRPLQPDELDGYRELVRQRGLRAPVHHLTGEREFFSRTFEVSPAVLIPRPETEFLVEKVLSLLREASERPSPTLIAELGAGSGNIAVTLACEESTVQIHASEISAEAIEVAVLNVERHSVRDRVEFCQGDLFSPFPERLRGELSFVLSNPPYIARGECDALMPEVRDHEPRIALDGGEDGLSFYRRLIPEAADWLRGEGWLLVEIGAGQAEAVTEMVRATGRYGEPEIVKDYAGIERVTLARKASG